jgi:hypothetical protein
MSYVPNLTIFNIDITGFFKFKSPKRKVYFIIITDRDSRVVWLYYLKYKNDIYNILINFIKMIKI